VSVQSAFAIAEFDCADDAANPTIVMIPASLNKNGLVIFDVWAINTETFGGTEDQGIITVSDESNNSLATLTVTNTNTPKDDMEQGSLTDYRDVSAGTASGARFVAAGEFVDAVVTQQTTGTASGKTLLIVEYLAIPS
jgi:hypothetical protein